MCSKQWKLSKNHLKTVKRCNKIKSLNVVEHFQDVSYNACKDVNLELSILFHLFILVCVPSLTNKLTYYLFTIYSELFYGFGIP